MHKFTVLFLCKVKDKYGNILLYAIFIFHFPFEFDIIVKYSKLANIKGDFYGNH